MAEESWDSIADWFIDRVAAGWALHDFVRDLLLAQLPEDLSGSRILDMGCGEGSLSRALADRGATVIGVDPTKRMIEAATRVSSPGIEFRVDNGETLSTVGDNSVGWVTAGTSLNAVGDLAAALASAHRVLLPGGRLAFTVPHPCFEAPHAGWHPESGRRVVGDYLAQGFWRSDDPAGVRRAGGYHRTVSAYLTALLDAGFTIEAVAEPEPGPAALAEQPHRAALPPFLAVRAVVKRHLDHPGRLG